MEKMMPLATLASAWLKHNRPNLLLGFQRSALKSNSLAG
jgi:hypothetical protein